MFAVPNSYVLFFNTQRRASGRKGNMSPETKAICEREWAVKTCRNWKAASVIELQEACKHVPGAVLLLIRRMALGLCTPNKGVSAVGRSVKRKIMKKNLWQDNSVQFPRLIAEAEASGAFTESVLQGMSDSMDLTKHEIGQLIDRAQAEWERIKQRTCPPKQRTRKPRHEQTVRRDQSEL